MDILRAHEADLKRMGVKRLFMFGSTARGDQGPDSDIDLFFDHDPGALSLFDVMDIQDTASRLLGQEAHVMTRNSIGPKFLGFVESDAVAVF